MLFFDRLPSAVSWFSKALQLRHTINFSQGKHSGRARVQKDTAASRDELTECQTNKQCYSTYRNKHCEGHDQQLTSFLNRRLTIFLISGAFSAAYRMGAVASPSDMSAIAGFPST